MSRWEWAGLAVVAAIFVLLVASFLLAGPQLMGDSQRYLGGADQFLTTGNIEGKAGNYKGYVLFVAAVKSVVADDATQKWLIISLHAVLEGVALLCLYSLGRVLFGARAGLIAAGLYALNFYALRWTPQIATESLFMACIIIASWICIKASRSPWLWLAALPVTVFATSIRPNGIAMLPVFLLFFLFSIERRLRLVLIAVMCAGFLLVFPAITEELNRAAGHENLVAQFEKGTVIWHGESVEMAQLDSESGNQLVDVIRYASTYPLETLALMGRRLKAAWLWQRTDYSDRHNLFLAIVLPVLYVFAALGLYRQCRSRITATFLLPVALVFAQSAVIAISFANHDHRFAAMVMPLIFLYSAHGAVGFLDVIPRIASRADRKPRL